MTGAGLGDRWLAGERLDGVAFALNDAVVVTSGRFEERWGTVALLMAVAPEPVYLVTLAGEGGTARVRQAHLRAAS